MRARASLVHVQWDESCAKCMCMRSRHDARPAEPPPPLEPTAECVNYYSKLGTFLFWRNTRVHTRKFRICLSVRHNKKAINVGGGYARA